MAADSEQHQAATGESSASIAQAIQEVSERAQTLVREEIELAKAEMSAKTRSLARGAAIGAAAGVFVIAALVLILHGLAWLAYWAIPVPDSQFFWGFFIVAGVLIVLAVVAGLLAAKAFKRGTPPKPQLAIDEAKRIRQTVTSSRPEHTI